MTVPSIQVTIAEHGGTHFPHRNKLRSDGTTLFILAGPGHNENLVDYTRPMSKVREISYCDIEI